MRFLPTARLVAATAGIAGAALLGVSLNGMASVDRDLAAAVAPVPAAQFDRVVYAPPSRTVEREWSTSRADCPRPPAAPSTGREL